MHPGGFAGGDPSMESAAASYARSVGFSTESLDCPLCDIRGALGFTAQVARSVDGPVYAYGDSAGGTLAARLTERNLVRAGAGYSPVANVRRFVNDRRASCIGDTDRLTAWAASPDAHRSARHFLELIADGEYPAVYRQAEVDWANAGPMVIGREVSGFHLGATSRPTYLQHMHEAIDWLAQRAG
jgi:hypothetical protein